MISKVIVLFILIALYTPALWFVFSFGEEIKHSFLLTVICVALLLLPLGALKKITQSSGSMEE